jgi:hypothetical protein
MPEPSLADACVPLLRGVVYADTHPAAWEALLAIPGRIRDHLAPLGLVVHLDEAEGYAFVRPAPDDDATADVPKLVSRRQLSYRVSLLLVLLRRRMLELDAQGAQTRLVLTRDELVELVRTYHPTRANEARLAEEVEADVRKVAELGFVRPLRNQPHTYEVRRIIKAFIDAQWLADFDARLESFLAEAAG